MERKKILKNFLELFKKDKKLFFYLLYYSLIEGVLVLSVPLALDYTINSVIAHATYSVIIIGLIIMVLFIFITLARVVQQYISEKFQQKIFVENALEIFDNTHGIALKKETKKEPIQKTMNYFFDIILLQKFFPNIMLEGVVLLINIIVGFLLLLAFDIVLFELATVIMIIYVFMIVILGFNGIKYAKYRSDMKHETIYFLQNLPFSNQPKEVEGKNIDKILYKYIHARQQLFKVMIRQKTLSFFMQGIIYTLFFIVGGFLVINGNFSVGEFVAAEIIIVFINNAITNFIKQIDYFYEVIEGIYKIGRLKKSIGLRIND